ncbi:MULTISPECIES: hypothetical protein [Rahnella]|uniref:hypothetical protein n=1 Tax=Rahnella TaxID=34037 RepID=UPI003F6E0105
MKNITYDRLKDFERDPSSNFLTRSEMMEAVKELIALRELKPEISWPVAQKVRAALDRAACPDAFMRIAVEACTEALKGDQVPVAIELIPEGMKYSSALPEFVGDSNEISSYRCWIHGNTRKVATQEQAYADAKAVCELLTAPQKPVVVLTDCDIGAVSHMAHWYSEEQCEAWVAGVEHAKKQIVAAGCIVQTGDTDKEDDHQSSAPAVLHDVLTAVSIGGSRTELIDALTAIKPKFGAPGSRDVDVRAAHLAIDKAIEKLSNL